jgi:hypothetical protein
MKDAYAAQLSNLLTRERGDWVLSFKRKYFFFFGFWVFKLPELLS